MWLNTQVSFYNRHTDNLGRPAAIGDILFTRFAVPHDGLNDLETIIELRNLDRSAPDYKQRKIALKGLLQCYTPAALLETKEKGKLKEIERSGIMQLDFDYQDICEYDIDELKRCVFDLPFVGFCGKSPSGDGFYALALIAEPDRLFEYAEHTFDVLLKYGIKADTSKGKKVENLRYVSYDSNMLIRDYPEPLRIKRFKPQPARRSIVTHNAAQWNSGENPLVRNGIAKIQNAQVGQRWQTVQQVAYTFGGLNDQSLLSLIQDAIKSNQYFSGEEEKYCKCARDCFAAGAIKPLVRA